MVQLTGLCVVFLCSGLPPPSSPSVRPSVSLRPGLSRCLTAEPSPALELPPAVRGLASCRGDLPLVPGEVNSNNKHRPCLCSFPGRTGPSVRKCLLSAPNWYQAEPRRSRSRRPPASSSRRPFSSSWTRPRRSTWSGESVRPGQRQIRFRKAEMVSCFEVAANELATCGGLRGLDPSGPRGSLQR